jgi:hypothetical protein
MDVWCRVGKRCLLLVRGVSKFGVDRARAWSMDSINVVVSIEVTCYAELDTVE